MKLESNNKLLGGGGGGGGGGAGAGPAEARASAEQIIDDILAEFSRPPPPHAAHPQHAPPAPLGFATSAEDIDPASDLGASIRSKCLELEEILQSLKTRLNHVVLDENIVLSPEADSPEAQLERDMDTDCTEDLSLQEFLELLHSQTQQSTKLQ